MGDSENVFSRRDDMSDDVACNFGFKICFYDVEHSKNETLNHLTNIVDIFWIFDFKRLVVIAHKLSIVIIQMYGNFLVTFKTF